MAPAPASSAVIGGSSSAFGESATVSVTAPIVGTTILGSGPLPQSSGTAPAAYNDPRTVLSAALVGVLSTGVINTGAASNIDGLIGARFASAFSTVNDLNIGLLGVLGLTATQVSSTAQVSGSPGSVAATGTTVITGLQLNGATVLLASVTPNFELLNAGGVTITLNEQTVIGSGNNQALSVNAIRVTLTNVGRLSETLNGSIVIGHSEASLSAVADPVGVPEPATLLVLAAGLAGVAATRRRTAT